MVSILRTIGASFFAVIIIIETVLLFLFYGVEITNEYGEDIGKSTIAFNFINVFSAFIAMRIIGPKKWCMSDSGRASHLVLLLMIQVGSVSTAFYSYLACKQNITSPLYFALLIYFYSVGTMIALLLAYYLILFIIWICGIISYDIYGMCCKPCKMITGCLTENLETEESPSNSRSVSHVEIA